MPKYPKHTGTFSNILEEAIETSSSLEDALNKLDGWILEALNTGKLPDMLSVITSVVKLTTKYPQEETRRGIENGAKMIFHKLFSPKTFINEAMFFPNEDNESKLISYVKFAKRYCYAAIYTITNNNLARILYSLYKKGVDVRIITDDETSGSQGCDIQDLANAGILIRKDGNMTARMHHKFIIIDDELLLNGSFNWTVTAVKSNNENVVATSDPQLI